MAQNTSNTTPFIEAEQYSKMILENLPDMLLPDTFSRDVSDFGAGTTLNIKSIGSATLQDLEEDVPPTFNAIDTGNVTLTITDFVGDAWSISDKLREDGAQVEQLHAMRAMEASRTIAEDNETKFLAAANGAQTEANVGLVNGRPHRWVAGGVGGTTRIMTMSDFIAMKLSFDKSHAPQGGRIAVVDPIVEATLNSLTNLVNVSNNPMFQGVVTEGFARDHKFLHNIFGWDIYTSNMLPAKTATEALDASSYNLANDTAEIGDIANIFMNIMDDGTKPIMRAERRAVRTEGWRDNDNEQDKYKVSRRYGFGAQRIDTLGVIFTDEATY